MSVSGLLERVKLRALARDSICATAVAIALLGGFYLLFGALDYFLVFPKPYRLVALAAGAAALASIVLGSILRAKRRDAPWAALRVERAVGSLNNELVMMAESDRAAIPPYLRKRLEASLASKLSSVKSGDVLSLWPSRRVFLLLGQVAAAYAALLIFLPGPASRELGRLLLMDDRVGSMAVEAQPNAADNATSDGDLVEELRLVLTPPDYTRREASVQVYDGNILALEGTRAELVVRTRRDDTIAFLSLGGADDVRMTGDGRAEHRASFLVKEDSTYRVTVRSSHDPDSEWEGVYSIKAIKDGPPEVHIVQPASDLLFQPEKLPASLPVRVRAKDEFEVGAIKLRYIKATGEGDASQFESGEIRLRPVTASEGVWRGAISLDLKDIGLGPGVSVVLHAEATDNNALTGPSTGFSESIIIQVAEPEKEKLEVDNLSPNEVLRFLTSQRMILIKTERLHRQRGRLSSEDLLARSNEIAAEQRRFRESFNEFTDLEPEHDHEAGEAEAGEEAEPEGHNAALPEIPSGASKAVRSMVQAIRAMWRAEAELRLASTAAAIEFEKEALLHLKEAQSGLRYFTQVAANVKPIDLKRRYKGRLDDIRDRLERTRPYSEHPSARQLSSILAELYGSARALAVSGSQSGQLQAAGRKLERVSEDVLQVRGVETPVLVELSSKLKLLNRMVEGGGLEERQKVIKLLADVCDKVASLLLETGPPGTVPRPQNLNPSSASKAAAYFKLLSTPR